MSKTVSAKGIQDGKDSSQAASMAGQYFLHSTTFKGMKDAGEKGSCILPPLLLTANEAQQNVIEKTPCEVFGRSRGCEMPL